jgi:hypothetical protein
MDPDPLVRGADPDPYHGSASLYNRYCMYIDIRNTCGWCTRLTISLIGSSSSSTSSARRRKTELKQEDPITRYLDFR